MQIIVFEGLPLVGKTTLINYIKSLNNKNVNCVDELILNTEELNQESFMKNDLAKINKYKEGLVFIDKALISTLSYNQMLEYLNGNSKLADVEKWFNEYGIPFYKRDDVLTLYLKAPEKRLREENPNTPHGSIENQIKMEKITIDNIKKYCKNYQIIEYNQNEMGVFVNEIINKYL